RWRAGLVMFLVTLRGKAKKEGRVLHPRRRPCLLGGSKLQQPLQQLASEHLCKSQHTATQQQHRGWLGYWLDARDSILSYTFNPVTRRDRDAGDLLSAGGRYRPKVVPS